MNPGIFYAHSRAMPSPHSPGIIAAMYRATLTLILMLTAINGQSLDTVPTVYIPGEHYHPDGCPEWPLNVLPMDWEYVETWLDGEWSPLVIMSACDQA